MQFTVESSIPLLEMINGQWELKQNLIDGKLVAKLHAYIVFSSFTWAHT